MALAGNSLWVKITASGRVRVQIRHESNSKR